MAANTEGWCKPANSKSAHFYKYGRSLCGASTYFGRLAEATDQPQRKCVTCFARRKSQPEDAEAR